MTAKEENKNPFNTCLDGFPFAEMIQKMKERQGIGSLCSEMMKKVMEKREEGAGFPCCERMGSMMKMFAGTKKEDPKEEDHA